MQRPLGVTILAWLAIVGGAFAIISSVVSFFAGIAALFLVPGVGIILLLLSVWILVLGVADIIFGVGALGLKGWAWTFGIVLMGLSILSSLVEVFSRSASLGGVFIGLLINAVILYYLFTAEVKAAFGKTGVGPDMPPIGAMGTPAQPAAGGSDFPGYQNPPVPPSTPAPGAYTPPAPPAAPAPPAPPAAPAAPVAPVVPAAPAAPVAPAAPAAPPAAPAAPLAPPAPPAAPE